MISKKVIKVGFIGSINSVNISAIKNVEFIAKKLPNITFLIAGDICQHVTSMSKNIILMGKIDNINDYYKNIDLTISPTFKSTGQKIKVTESIFNGVPSLTSRDSKPDFISDYFFNNLETSEDFIKVLLKIKKENLEDIINIQKEIISKMEKKIISSFLAIEKFSKSSKFNTHKEK